MAGNGRIPEVLSSDVVFSGHFRVVRDRLRLKAGQELDYDYVESLEAAAVFLVDRGEVVLLRQYRHPIKRFTHDLPAGSITKGETPIQAALRECEEETGLRPEGLTPLGIYNHCPGAMDSRVHLFYAGSATEGRVAREVGEDIELVRIPAGEFWEFIKDKEVEPIVPLGFLAAKEKGLLK